MISKYSRLYRALDYTFQNEALIDRALTHRSKSVKNYERLEFLGDSILGFTISAELYKRFPELPEGALTRLRASLVRKETLAELARKVDLGRFLNLGSGESRSGGHDRDSILADALEAVFGAVYQDRGTKQAVEVVLHLYRGLLDDIKPDSITKDPKTLLQEYLQKKSGALPVYRTLEVTGEPHSQRFLVECVVPGLDEPVKGEGGTRRKAEQRAASRAYDLLRGS